MKKGIKDASNPTNILADEIGKEAGTLEQLPARIDRYEKAKIQSDSMYYYIEQNHPRQQKLYTSIRDCASYLLFHHYPSVNQLKLRQTYTCKKPLLCRFCAIRRGSKLVFRYLDRFKSLVATNPTLKPYMVTFTVVDGADLKERYNHLKKSLTHYHKFRHLKKSIREVQKASAATWSYEFKRGKNSQKWHPHVHAIWLCETPPSQSNISQEWFNITGDSFIIDVTPMDIINPEKGFLEVFKYAIKFSDQPQEDTWHCYETLRSKRLIGSFGDFYGIPEPDDLLDDPLEGLEFEIILYNFINGKYKKLT
jgi:hypothetical protein